MFARISRLGRKLILFSCEEGSVALHVGLMAVVIVAMAGLGSEITLMFAKHRQMQVVADAAALSAVAARLRSSNSSAPLIEAKAISAQLGYASGANGVTVTMNNPPASGGHTSNLNAYEVIVNQPQSLGLVSVLHSSIFVVQTRAVAVMTSNTNSPVCALALDRTASRSIYLSNNAALTTSSCGVASNSNSSSALYLNNNAYINGAVSVVGGWQLQNHAELNNSSQTQHGPTIDDPYKNVTLPAAPACTQQPSGGKGNFTLSAGHFCNGWNFGNNAVLNLSAGVYYVDSKLSLQNNVVVNGTGGVTIVINGDYAIDIGNNAQLNISAPTTGNTSGIAIMGLPTGTSDVVQTFSNNTTMNIEGAVYFPNQIVNFENNATTGRRGCTQIIGRILQFSNNVALDSACDDTGVKEVFIPQSALVE